MGRYNNIREKAPLSQGMRKRLFETVKRHRIVETLRATGTATETSKQIGNISAPIVRKIAEKEKIKLKYGHVLPDEHKRITAFLELTPYFEYAVKKFGRSPPTIRKIAREAEIELVRPNKRSKPVCLIPQMKSRAKTQYHFH